MNLIICSLLSHVGLRMLVEYEVGKVMVEQKIGPSSTEEKFCQNLTCKLLRVILPNRYLFFI